MKELLKRLKKLSLRETLGNMDDLFGENPDDAYYRGVEDGSSHISCDILNDLNESYRKYVEQCEKIGKPFHDLGDFVEERLNLKEGA